MRPRLRALSTLVAASLVVWALAPRGHGGASLERTSRVGAWALFYDGHRKSLVLAAGAVERDQGATLFVYARLLPRPELLVGSRPLLGDEVADASGQRIIVPRRAVPAVDLLTGEPTECAVSLTVSRLEGATDVRGLVCGIPFARIDTIAADVRQTTEMRDVARIF